MLSADEKKIVLVESGKIMDSLNLEADRGVVLVAAAMLENNLEDGLKKLMRPSVQLSDDVFSNGKATFSLKISLAYRLGLMSIDEYKVCEQLRSLRNKCAHEVSAQTFDENHFKDRTKNMIQHSNVIWCYMADYFGPIFFPDSPPKDIDTFVNSVGWLNSFRIFFSIFIATRIAISGRIKCISC